MRGMARRVLCLLLRAEVFFSACLRCRMRALSRVPVVGEDRGPATSPVDTGLRKFPALVALPGSGMPMAITSRLLASMTACRCID